MSASAQSRWRASPTRLSGLLLGLAIFGAGDALVVLARLGNSPWTVLAEGVADRTVLGVGSATVVISFFLLLLWIPLRQRPGLGTILNALLVGVALGVVLSTVPEPRAVVLRVVVLLIGIALVGVGSGFYLGAALGPGPRDGLMTGLHRRTGVRVAIVRGGIELSATVVGALLGGTVGIGTLAFALLIGPSVALGLRVLSATPAAEL